MKFRNPEAERHLHDATAMARHKADLRRAEDERKAAIAAQSPHPAQHWPGTSPEAVEARRQQAAARLEADRVAQQAAQAFRAQVAEATLGAQRAREAAVATRDLEGFVAAHQRHAALVQLLAQLDRADRDRKDRAAHPFVAGAVPL